MGEENFLHDFGEENLEERLLDKPRYKREDDIKVDLNEIGWGRGLN